MKTDADLLLDHLREPAQKEKAFEELVDLYQERLYWYIRKIVLTHENADDVLQETFLRIFRGIESFQGKSSLLTWMYRIAHNESLRFLQKNKMSKNTTNLDESTYFEKLTSDPYFDGDEVKKKLHETLLDLTEKQRRVFQMKYFDDLSFRQIAEILEVNENTLRSSYYSSVKTIRQRMLAEINL